MKSLRYILLMLVAIVSCSALAGIRVTATVDTDLTVGAAEDLHISSADAPFAEGAEVNLNDDDSRLFFDNIRPSDVIAKYCGSVRIKGEALEPDVNARIAVYGKGTEILPHTASYCPLSCFTAAKFSGEESKFSTGYYYTNSAPEAVEAANVRALEFDNKIQSFTLARGYMATFATEPDGLGYSRCFIADDNDLRVELLPGELAGKVSFVRVFPWQRPSKKGWVGGNSKVDPPEGYLEQQCDATGSSWCYNWGSSADGGRSPKAKGTPWRNQEFVPEKWGAGGTNGWKQIFNDMSFTHLLSYNEPDHSEQSNVSVERALAEWPKHMQTGLRLGSPATTDFNWLYRFMEGARERNYRVDYIAIHAYWGGSGSSVQVNGIDDWYKKLKEIHTKTGCPIWITEWNNGANWTKESWPSDKAEQKEKQRKFMTEVLTMMDTCSFIERYSVYNWVEEKRALFWGSLDLTPAGKVYRDFDAAPAFCRAKEVIPQWEVNSAPALTISYNGNRSFSLSWTDSNHEQVDGYVLEQSTDGNDYNDIATLPYGTLQWPGATADATASYRVSSLVDGRKAFTSTPRGFDVLDASTIYAGRSVDSKGAKYFVMPPNYSREQNIVIMGVPTYCMKSAMVPVVRHLDTDTHLLGIDSWNYNTSDSFVSRDTIPYIIFPEAGEYNVYGLNAIAGRATLAAGANVRIPFVKPMAKTPIVFANVTTANAATAAIVRVSNVGTDGFDAEIVYEAAATHSGATESIDYLAIEQGSANSDDTAIYATVCKDVDAGISTATAARIDYNGDYPSAVAFAATQSVNDGAKGAILRAVNINGSGIKLIRNEETSAANLPATVAEDIALCVIGSSGFASAAKPVTLKNALRYIDGSFCYTNGTNADADVRIFSIDGNEHPSDIDALNKGVYIATAPDCSPLKIKK